MKVDKITSPVWADRGHTTINCIVKFSDAETECVFTASADDPESYGREIFEACIRGDAGPVGEYRANDDMAVEEARRMKNAEINAWRDAMEASGYVFEHRGRKWDYGKETMTRLGMSASAARGGVLPEGFFWTDAENNDVPMTADELISLSDAAGKAMFRKGLEIHIRQREMKKAIAELSDSETILAYRVGW
ncbi:DUF4376 domain-containing protein [Escherichia coli]|uniref:DUF4376 domain-containing protein n=14 Tax=Escherichia coli TaxID=562 RepID=A0A0D8W9F1_ECOLX|nr:DUF4376 domain-containing protein [Escherichia coli]EEZ7066329.1 DUF4376 domain-containing protein [Escherichia coli O17]EGB64810.1 hypothetical protein ERHG_04412 [Escherichia coli TA007]OSL64402.1 putative tail component of prophage [Escherichia coli TA008]AWS61603.1 DUF4376 domain-containing protein [Escherichia coli]AYW30313.1 DUF4376 domain-containing protein [Escherichia coli]